MGENTKIEWCDHTFNPWIGCQKVSPGCDRWGKVDWGPHGERVLTSDSNWAKPAQWDRAAAKRGVRARVFCASLADWLDNRVSESTPNLDWLLLTKRIENFGKHAPWHDDDIPKNVWLGVTCEDQAHFERRWEILHTIPVKTHFISYDPALGPLSIRDWWVTPEWIICGGESGHGARAMDPAWARNLRDECAGAGVKFFMKQMTGKASIPDDLLVREFPSAMPKVTA